MDLTQAIIARSDQLNADDLIGGPQTFTIAEVREGSSEQPVSIVLAEWLGNRPFKPSKTVLRILVHAWGKETDDWPKGARMTLYRAAEVKWAGEEVGGIRVSHLSHIDAPLKVALKESQKKKHLWTVLPLPDATPADPPLTDAMIASATDVGQLGAWWKQYPGQRSAIEARVAEVKAAAAPADVAGEQVAGGGQG